MIDFRKRKPALAIGIITSAVLLSFYSYCQESPGKDLQEGIWNYKHENFDEALVLLEEARTSDPESSLAAYYLGLTYKQLQDYRQARLHLEASVNLTPRIKGALIELIDVLYRLDDLEEAKKWVRVAELEYIRPAQVAFLKGVVLLKEEDDINAAIKKLEEAKELDNSLAKISDYHIGIAYLKSKRLKEAKGVFKGIVEDYPSTDLASFADQYIDAISKREEAMRPLKLVFTYAFQYDDNVVLKPGDAGLATVITDKDDFRQVYRFKSNYDFRPGESFGTRLGYDFSYGKQFDFGFYDTVGNEFSLQPSFYLDKFMLSFPASYSHLIVNDKNYLSLVSVGNLDNYMLAKNQMIQGSIAYRNKDYLGTPSMPSEDRDSNELLGAMGYYYFFADNKGFLNLKYTANYDNTEGNNWKYFGNKATVTGMVPIKEKLRLTVVGEFFLQNFLRSHTVFNEKRLDESFLLSALLGVEIFKGAELQFQYTFVDNKSNLNIYEYGRNFYSAGVKYKF
ncbi:MAG: tetratricopeptide repeat protein [Candidatus Omnitrophota bacterium]